MDLSYDVIRDLTVLLIAVKQLVAYPQYPKERISDLISQVLPGNNLVSENFKTVCQEAIVVKQLVEATPSPDGQGTLLDWIKRPVHA